MKASTLLKRNFERQKRMHGLTLRELASRTHVSPGFLSKVFSGQKSLTGDLAESLCAKLHLDDLQRGQVFEQLKAGLIREKLGKWNSKNRIKNTDPLSEFHLMDTDAEWLLGKWYRLVLLDLVTCVDFQQDHLWIASRLSIPPSDAGRCLKDLEKFGFLTREDDGKLKKTHERLRFPMKFSKAITRDFHSSQIKRAMSHLHGKTNQKAYEARLITSLGVASDPAHIARAKQILHEALYEAALVLAEGEPTEVYQINLQLFPQTEYRAK